MVFLFSPCWCWLAFGLLVLAAAGLRPVILTGGVLTRPLLGLALLLRLLCLARVGRLRGSWKYFGSKKIFH